MTPWVSDRRALPDRLDRHQWIAFGRLLAGVHATAISADLAAAVRTEQHRQPRLSARIRELDRRLVAITSATCCWAIRGWAAPTRSG